MSKDPRHSADYVRLRRLFIRAAAPGTACALCGLPIDVSLPGSHRWGPTIEHTVPVRDAPHLALDVSLWRLAHARCQQQQGARVTNGKRRRKPPPSWPQQRRW